MRWSGGVAVGCLLLLSLIACGGGKGGDGAADAPAGGDQRLGTCAVTEAVREHMLGNSSFEAVVEAPPDSAEVEGIAAAVVLVRSQRPGSLGPYQPVIDHLADVGQVQAKRKGRAPKRTEAVVASAQRLDRDLADGMCDGERGGG